MKTWIAAAVLAAGSTQIATAQAERHDIALKLGDEGSMFAYRYSMQLLIEQQQGERALAPQSASHDLVLDFTVRTMDPSGDTELALSIEAATIVVTDGSGDGAVRRTIQVPPHAPADPADTTATGLFAVGKALDDALIIFKVAPSGDVKDITGLTGFIQAFAALESADARLVGPLEPRQLENLLEAIFTADGAAGTTRAIGAGWQQARSVEVPPVAVLEFTDDVKFASVTTGKAVLESAGRIEVRRPAAEAPARPTLAVDGYESTVTTRWHLADGCLESRLSKMNMATRWQLGEIDLRQQQTAKQAIERIEAR